MNANVQDARTNLRTQLRTVQHQLAEMKQDFIAALPPTIHSDRFVRVVMTTLQTRPELLSADRKSLLLSCQKCAADGLLPDGREATIVLFNEGDEKPGGSRNKQAVYMPMYQGLIKQIRNSGELKSISAHVVFARDKFQYVQGDEEKIIHEPLLDGERGPAIGVYAIVHAKDGGIYRSFLTRKEVEARKQRSQTGRKDKGPWKTDEAEMWTKSAIRAVSKLCPKSAEMDRYLEVMRDADDKTGMRLAELERSPMPDESSLESTRFHLKTEALSAIAEAQTIEATTEILRRYGAECKKIDQDAEIEVEAAAHDHIEAIKQRVGAG